tara:strand:- start:874 stop:1569 length:696 start_codon:yes stop_codon:yes gene_type:complete
MTKEVKTPWGKIIPEVSLFPIYYLIFIYCFVYILPYGKFFIGISWFDWLRSEDGPLEWIQFIEYASSSLFAFIIFLKKRNKKEINSIIWIFLACILFLIAGEEISWGERLTGLGITSISNLNVQGETNFHNLPFFHNYLLDPVFEITCIFLGWFGWRRFTKLNSLPGKYLSLYFLFVALFYFYFDISWASTTQQIRNDQEIFEFLLSTGIFLHCFKNMKFIKFKKFGIFKL